METALRSGDPAAILKQTERLRAAQAIATGTPPAATDALTSAIARAFAQDVAPPERLVALVRDDALGEAILRSITLAAAGAKGDPAALTNALAFLRKSGLEDTARRHALQSLLRAGPAQ